MNFGRTSARISLLVAVATLVSGGVAHLSGPPAACAFTDPFATTATAEAEPGAPRREVKTIGMMLAEHPPV